MSDPTQGSKSGFVGDNVFADDHGKPADPDKTKRTPAVDNALNLDAKTAEQRRTGGRHRK
jgi:hypothetical protein